MRRFLSVMLIATLAFYASASMTEWATAQEMPVQDDTPIARTAPATSADFLARYKARVDKVGALSGPWDVVIGTTDKAANSIKYSNVPFVFFGNGFIAFHGGTSTKGQPDYIIASNFTLYMRKK